MKSEYYKKIGFKCGLELHIQLETHKLFCDCESRIREDKPDMLVERQLRSVAGEMGGKDIAAEAEELLIQPFAGLPEILIRAERTADSAFVRDAVRKQQLLLGYLRSNFKIWYACYRAKGLLKEGNTEQAERAAEEIRRHYESFLKYIDASGIRRVINAPNLKYTLALEEKIKEIRGSRRFDEED